MGTAARIGACLLLAACVEPARAPRRPPEVFDDVTVGGTIRDAAGKGIVNVDVSIAGTRRVVARSGANGVWTARAPRGHLDITLNAGGYGEARQSEVPAFEDTTVDAILHPEMRVAGVVLNPDGSPAVGAHVYPSMFPLRDRMDITDAAGRFTFEELPLAPLNLLVMGERGATRVQMRDVTASRVPNRRRRFTARTRRSTSRSRPPAACGSTSSTATAARFATRRSRAVASANA